MNIPESICREISQKTEQYSKTFNNSSTQIKKNSESILSLRKNSPFDLYIHNLINYEIKREKIILGEKIVFSSNQPIQGSKFYKNMRLLYEGKKGKISNILRYNDKYFIEVFIHGSNENILLEIENAN